MAAQVKLNDVIEALELATDEGSSYLDRETGEVHLLTDAEFRLAEDEKTVLEDLPQWQREPIQLARRIQEQEGQRYVALPSKFDVHEWAIMDRFCHTLEDGRVRNDLRSAIRGAGAFRMFKRLLSEYNLWDAWNRFKQAELRRTAVEWCEQHGVAYRER